MISISSVLIRRGFFPNPHEIAPKRVAVCATAVHYQMSALAQLAALDVELTVAATQTKSSTPNRCFHGQRRASRLANTRRVAIRPRMAMTTSCAPCLSAVTAVLTSRVGKAVSAMKSYTHDGVRHGQVNLSKRKFLDEADRCVAEHSNAVTLTQSPHVHVRFVRRLRPSDKAATLQHLVGRSLACYVSQQSDQ